LEKLQIEKAEKDKKHHVFDKNFRIEVHMSEVKNYVMTEKSFVG